ncbi:uncharacterized protein LOC133205002 [Saccostrea echinata]|uniref:uncharacterized protein LOC133205002 n=1 Tax=Saccostrea echinata TaxID=191078 RepID=UPI002A83BD99|nr:uncharacterized protein LOC133205002 [Saccostrea echinata]
MFHDNEEDDESCLEEIGKLSSFSLETEIQLITHEKFKERLKKLEKDIEHGYDTIEETICFHNFVSFLYWKCDKTKRAMELATKARELGSKISSLGETKNIVTICNFYHFHKGKGDVVKSRKFLRQFKELSKRDDFKKLKYSAKAELAVCISKLGPFCATKAIGMFRESVEKISTTVDCWQFYFALTLRRKTHLLAIQNKTDAQLVEEDREAFDLFMKVIKNTSSKNLKTRSLCEIGLIIYNNRYKQNRYRDMNHMEYFEEAVKVNPKSYHALQRYGQHLRYQKNLEKSREILEKSLNIRETAIAYHHLGLTFQKMVLLEYSEKKKAKPSHRKNMPRQKSLKVRSPNMKNNNLDKTLIGDTSHGQMRAKMKSVRHPPPYPGDDRLLNAEQNLEKALLLDVSFDKARYDLGLVQRMLEKSDEALENFRYITNSYKGKTSNQIQLLFAYEQQAFCRFDLFETSKNENDIINAVDALNRALDILSLYIDALPDLKSVSSCIRELEETMNKYDCLHLGEESRKDNFARLYEKSKEYKKAYELYSTCEPKTAAVFQNMVENLKAAGDYENAIGILNKLITDKDPNIPSRQFLFRMYMEGASYSLENRNFEETKMRFLQCRKCVPAWESYDEENMIDFHILHICEERCPLAEKLVQVLTQSLFIKWNVTKNLDDCKPGHKITIYHKDVIERTKFKLLYYHENQLDCDDNNGEFLKMQLEHLSISKEKDVLNVIQGDVEQPPHHPTIVLPNDFASAEEDGEEDLDMHALEGRLILDILMKTFGLQETMLLNSDEENESCLEEIRKLSSFYLEADIHLINHRKFEERLNKLVKDIEFGYDTTEETICFHNFVSFLYWKCDERKKAIELATKALELGNNTSSLGATDNIVTICNFYHFHEGNGDVVESYKFLRQFRELSKRDDFQQLKYIAKAELAVSISKLGPFCATKAIDMFRESVDKISTTVDCWQFYFALTLRRKTHLFTIQNKTDAELLKEDREAFDIFMKVIENTSSKNLKSRALTEVGLIIYNNRDKYKDENYMEYLEKAVEVNPKSYHALQRYGQYLRYGLKLQKSKEILEKSLKIRETTIAYHHLGLTFQKMVLLEHSEKKKAKLANRKNMSKQDSTKVRGISNSNSVETTFVKTSRDPLQVRAKMKSVRYVPLYPGDDRLLNAEQNLKKALQIVVSFNQARYDLGLVQRMLGKSDKALENFRFITNSYKGKTSDQIQLIVAYEQQAFCRFDLFKTSKNENDIINAVDALNRALDILSLYIDPLPELKSVSSCIQEIEDIMNRYEYMHSGEESRKNNFARLYEKAKEYKKAYELYSKCEPKTADVYQKMVENLKAAGDFENAIGILNRLIVDKDPNIPSRKFLFRMYKDGAAHSLENRNFEETKMRLLQCRKCIPAWEVHTENCYDEDNMPDFYILHICAERCLLAEKLVHVLAQSFFIKWNVTKNVDDCIPGHAITKYLTDIIKRAKFILLFYHENQMDCDDNNGEFLKMEHERLSIDKEKDVLNVIYGDAEQPSHHPTIVLPNDFATAKGDPETHDLEGRLTLDILMKTFTLSRNT